LETLLFSEHLATYFDAEKLLIWSEAKPEIIEISREVHQKLFVREGTEAFMAVVKMRNEDPEEFFRQKQGQLLILVAESPEKPGNIGALLRTADGAGVDAVFIANPHTDMYNQHVIRSSLGCIFTLSVFTGSTYQILNWLKSNNLRIFCATLEAAEFYDEVNFPGRTAIVVGTEDKGLSEEWIIHSDKNIIIPMLGKADSLNLSVSTGILLYEVVRQRKLIK
jgi:TrmH family RNA methyltransferase